MIKNVEFYNMSGEILVKPEGESAYVLKETHREFISDMLLYISEMYPKAYKALMDLYSKSSRNRTYYEYRAVTRFIRCNFGEYDQLTEDIDRHGFFKFEEVKCPLRSECSLECILCKPKLNTCLTEREKEIFRLIADGLQSEDIASELSISINTVNRHRENIKTKIGVKSIAQMVTWWHNNQNP